MDFSAARLDSDPDQLRVIADDWLERVLKRYPEEALPSLQREADPFRNPVGHALREGLSVLVEEVLGDMDRGRIASALDRIVRIRAVQDVAPGRAVSFVFLLRDALGAHSTDRPEAIERAQGRVDELAALAFDLYMSCREKLYEIKANEVKRSLYLPSRLGRVRAVH